MTAREGSQGKEQASLLAQCMIADRHRLKQQWLRQAAKANTLAQLVDQAPQLAARLEASIQTAQTRRQGLPQAQFADDLPVNQVRDDIAAQIAAHQVIILSGETGSGKTTQLPKICLTLGRGVFGMIGHTQPRRLAASATAARIAEELQTELGTAVGYKVRFGDQTGDNTYIKLMTDGILLAELHSDRYLNRYDTIIVDEAHERSLNIDLLLGYLKHLLPKRPELKIIITSATLNAERLANYFADKQGQPAPMLDVSGRLYPITMLYRPQPLPRGDNAAVDSDFYDHLADVIDETQRHGRGDVLVFLPGEREIREAMARLGKRQRRLPFEVLPLFARQSSADQRRIFQVGQAVRVVLATNVAETSLTVPGIRYVVDSGQARVKRYSLRNKVEQLYIESISQAAAKQRAGRCGRVSDGVCFRLYDEADFNQRPAQTDPELLRSSLAGVILKMISFDLGNIESFEFLDPPSEKMIRDGINLLDELDALEKSTGQLKLSATGKLLAKLPLDPKIGRMIIAAREFAALDEVLVIAAALASQDVRDRPTELAQAADQAHGEFRGGEQDKRSEFVWYLNLWQAWRQVQNTQNQSAQRQWCKKRFLNYLRMREWREVYRQLHSMCHEQGWPLATSEGVRASYEAIHSALLTGLLGHIGLRQDVAEGQKQRADYLGARAVRFLPHPGSALARKAGKWIVAAELVDTGRLYGRCLAAIEPPWLEKVADHLISRHVTEPHWSKSALAVRGYEKGVLYGLPVYQQRLVSYEHINKDICRELFVRHALLLAELPEHKQRSWRFLQHNQALINEIEKLEHKSRRPDVLVDDALIEAFYHQKIPENIINWVQFEQWYKAQSKTEPDLLCLRRDDLMRHQADGITTENFPAHWQVHGTELPLAYVHEPGSRDDGVTVQLPVAMLNQISVAASEWLVPGLLAEKVQAIFKTLPPKHRHRLQPPAQHVEAFCQAVVGGRFNTSEPLLDAIRAFVREHTDLELKAEQMRLENLPPFMLMNFRAVDEHGRVLGQSRNLAELRARFHGQISAAFSAARITVPVFAEDTTVVEQQTESKTLVTAPAVASQVATVVAGDIIASEWVFGELPELLEVHVGQQTMVGFPALVVAEDKSGVCLQAFDHPEQALQAHRLGLRHLFALNLKETCRAISRLPGVKDLAMRFALLDASAPLDAELIAASLQRCCMMEPLPDKAQAFALRMQEGRLKLTLVAQEYMRLLERLLTEHAGLRKALTSPRLDKALKADIERQLQGLFPAHFMQTLDWQRLAHYPRYLQGVSLRLESWRKSPERDATLLSEWQSLFEPYRRECLERQRDPLALNEQGDLAQFRWILEELRIGLFAQSLKTPMPVSVKRVQKIWQTRPR